MSDDKFDLKACLALLASDDAREKLAQSQIDAVSEALLATMAGFEGYDMHNVLVGVGNFYGFLLAQFAEDTGSWVDMLHGIVPIIKASIDEGAPLSTEVTP